MIEVIHYKNGNTASFKGHECLLRNHQGRIILKQLCAPNFDPIKKDLKKDNGGILWTVTTDNMVAKFNIQEGTPPTDLITALTVMGIAVVVNERLL